MSGYLQQLRGSKSAYSQQPVSEAEKNKKKTVSVDSSLLQLEEEGVRTSRNLLICKEAKNSQQVSAQSGQSCTEPGHGGPSTKELQASKETTHKPASTRSQAAGTGTAFGGMKRGFLFSGNKDRGTQKKDEQATSLQNSQESEHKIPSAATATAGKSKEEMTFVKAKKQEEQQGMRFEEVQDEMKKAYPLLATQGNVTTVHYKL